MKATDTTVRQALARGFLVCLVASLCACDSGEKGAPTDQTAAAPTPAQAALPPAVPAPAVTQASWNPDALEELLAPIALYPDALLGQILAASVNSQEVLDAGNWLLQQTLQGDALDAAAQAAGFGPAMRALVQFPTVVDMMCQQIDWTRQLGSAFTSDQKAVLDAVQRLRAQAMEAGNLKSTPEQKVETKAQTNEQTDDQSGKSVVEIKPADPKVVYVPQYDPQVIYVQAPAAPATTTAQEDTVSTGTAVAAGLLAFGVGVALGNAFDDDDYPYPHWGSGAVYYGPRPFYPPAYVYRPAYGPAFRPAYGYAPPAGYRHSYNNVNVDRNVNVNVQNTNYFNRFDGNQNLRAGAAQSPLRSSQPVTAQNRDDRSAARTTAAARDDRARQESWKGQSTYAGARDAQTSERVAQAQGARQEPSRRPEVPRDSARETPRARSDVPAEVRSQDRPSGAGEERRDRGYDDAGRSMDRDTQRTTPERQSRDRGADAASRDNAFSGVQSEEHGSFDRAASARGHASAGQQRSSSRGGGHRR